MWESGAGRVRDPSRPKGPRVIDLDLLLVEGTVRDSPRLSLPHPGLAFRRFALEPLLELLPEAVDPVSGERWAEKLRALPGQGVDRAGRTW
jgi:2-amino-4-hydroxy-6-hydroxymethyldihydropteridine diphosphokinase